MNLAKEAKQKLGLFNLAGHRVPSKKLLTEVKTKKTT